MNDKAIETSMTAKDEMCPDCMSDARDVQLNVGDFRCDNKWHEEPIAAPLAPQSAPSETFPHALAGYLTRNGQVGNLPDMKRQIEDFMRDAKMGISPAVPLAPPIEAPQEITVCPKCNRPHYNMEDSEHCRNTSAPTWRCFHCDFSTSIRKEAEAHFGDRDDAEEFKPLCKWWQRMDQGERAEMFQDAIRELNEVKSDNDDLVTSNLLLREENERLKEWAACWHKVVETVLTINGLSPAMSADEATVALSDQLATLRASASSEGYRPCVS